MKGKFVKHKKKFESQQPADQVRAKKHLGQHFLKDESFAQKIGETLTLDGYKNILEIGPGTGVLTKYILHKGFDVVAMELDSESVIYLNHTFPLEHAEIMKDASLRVIEADFLKYDLNEIFGESPFAITGNFPYNISTQILF
ncbi:MAG: rRNA adenine N-6-methyltransferase family protein, partial [Leeuwenhoekiella sp.]